MSRGLSPRNVALCGQILAVLTDEAPLPVATGHVWRKISPYRPRPERLAALARGEYVPPEVPYSCVLNMLNWLERHRDDVEKITLPDKRSRYWRRWPDPEPGSSGAFPDESDDDDWRTGIPRHRSTNRCGPPRRAASRDRPSGRAVHDHHGRDAASGGDHPIVAGDAAPDAGGA